MTFTDKKKENGLKLYRSRRHFGEVKQPKILNQPQWRALPFQKRLKINTDACHNRKHNFKILLINRALFVAVVVVFKLTFALFLFLLISHYLKRCPWTWSKVGGHGPLVHVLSSSVSYRNDLTPWRRSKFRGENEWKCWTVQCERSILSKFSASRKFVRCRVNVDKEEGHGTGSNPSWLDSLRTWQRLLRVYILREWNYSTILPAASLSTTDDAMAAACARIKCKSKNNIRACSNWLIRERNWKICNNGLRTWPDTFTPFKLIFTTLSLLELLYFLEQIGFFRPHQNLLHNPKWVNSKTTVSF